MDAQKRMLLAMVLSAAVILAAQFFFAKPLPPVPDAGAPIEAPVAPPSPAPAGPPEPPAAQAPSAKSLPVRQIKVHRPLVDYVFSSEGAGLLSAELLGPKMREQEEVSWSEALGRMAGKHGPPAPQMNMAQPVAGEPLPLAVSVAGEKPFGAATRFEVEEDPSGRSVTFRGADNGWELTKRFSWADEGLELGLEVSVKNASQQARTAELAVHTIRAIDPAHEEAPSMFGGVGNQSQVGCAYADEYKHTLPIGKPPEEYKGPISFFGIDQQYFLGAVFPLTGALPGRCVLAASATERSATGYFPISLAPGASARIVLGVFLGPKDTDLLTQVPTAPLRALVAPPGAQSALTPEAAPRLERAVDYGMLAVIAKLMLAVLKFCHRLVGNWGVAVILLTVIVRLLMTPLNHRMMVGQVAMQKLQPKMEALKKKYPDDRERQQMEMMKIYQEAGVSPFGSCLFLVIQMPIWIALYATLRHSFEIYREPFFGPIWSDLTYKDPTYVLPVLLGISQIITTRLQPQTMDPAQARIMNWVMPIMFSAFLLKYPLGLTLYIFTSNVLGVIQQTTSKRLIAKAQQQK